MGSIPARENIGNNLAMCMFEEIERGTHACRAPVEFNLKIFFTGNSSLEPLLEGLCAQIHVNLS